MLAAGITSYGYDELVIIGTGSVTLDKKYNFQDFLTKNNRSLSLYLKIIGHKISLLLSSIMYNSQYVDPLGTKKKFFGSCF